MLKAFFKMSRSISTCRSRSCEFRHVHLAHRPSWFELTFPLVKLALGHPQSLRDGTNRLPVVDHPHSVSLELLIILATVDGWLLLLLHMTPIIRHTRVAQIRTISTDPNQRGETLARLTCRMNRVFKLRDCQLKYWLLHWSLNCLFSDTR